MREEIPGRGQLTQDQFASPSAPVIAAARDEASTETALPCPHRMKALSALEFLARRVI
jgi:hypothetical protein